MSSPPLETSLCLINLRGLHARAATKLVALIKDHNCQVEICFAGKSANGQSLMSVLMLGASQGSELVFRIQGEQQQKLQAALTQLINDRFGEEC